MEGVGPHPHDAHRDLDLTVKERRRRQKEGGDPCEGCGRPLCWPGVARCARCDPPDTSMLRVAPAPFDTTRRAGVRWPTDDPKRIGRPPCRRCGDPCPGRRTSWCSEECADWYIARNMTGSWSVVAKLKERDGPGCQRCGVDLEALGRRIERMRYPDRRIHWSRYGWQNDHKDPPWLQQQKRRAYYANQRQVEEVQQRARRVLQRLGFDRGIACFQVDHVIGVKDGGADLGLPNLRLLCVPCHKKVTAEQVGRRAAKARSKKRRQRRFPDWG